jgi:glucose-6-phosphate 1-dehydrogenase
MEVPAEFEAESVHFEKIKALRSVRPIEPSEVVLGQYSAGKLGDLDVPGYREEPGVPSESNTETFVALTLFVDNWRWQGVPFHLRTGKRLPRRLTEIVVNFRRPPICMFRTMDGCDVERNTLILRLQPDEGFRLWFGLKVPGEPFDVETMPLTFNYGQAFETQLPPAYETLLLAIVAGDQTLFVHAGETEAAWALYTPLLSADIPRVPYAAGSWGPEQAASLILDERADWFSQ